MNEKIKAHLTAYCQSKGWATDDDSIKELLTETKPLFKEVGDAHRWYDELFIVVDINGMLLGYDYYHTTGDNSLKDMDLELNLNTVREVEAKEKTVTYYVDKV